MDVFVHTCAHARVRSASTDGTDLSDVSCTKPKRKQGEALVRWDVALPDGAQKSAPTSRCEGVCLRFDLLPSDSRVTEWLVMPETRLCERRS